MRPTPYLFETEEHALLRETAKRFAEGFIAPHADVWEAGGEFPRDLYRSAGEAGILGVGYPPELGGSGGDMTHVLAAQDALLFHGRSVGTCAGLGTHAIALPPIVRHGSASLKARVVAPVLAGEKVAALAITEPGAGSDVARLQTRAVREGDHFVVRGAKTFISSGSRADVVTVAVRTGGDGHAGLSLLAVERGTPGFSVGRKLEKTGWCASDTAELFFDDCPVPAANLIGEEGQGFIAIMVNFANERLYLAGQCVAIAELAYRESIAYARNRSTFGKPLTGHQVIRHKLADMATRIAAARALVGECAVRVSRDETVPGLAAMTKNAATDMVSFVVDQAVQIHGGSGYMRGTLVERLYRDARLYPIGGGTREIMNEIISKTEAY